MYFDIKDRAALFSRRKVLKYCQENDINLIREGYHDKMTYIQEDVLFSKVLGYNLEPSFITGTTIEWYENWQTISSEHRIDSILFFDTETTTINGYVCSIALVTLDLETLIINEDLTTYLEFNPNEIIFEDALTIHGLTQDYLSDKEFFADQYENIKRIIDYSELMCAHNANFDIGIVNKEFKRMHKDKLNNLYFIDTMKRLKITINAKDTANKLKYPTLKECCIFYGIKIDEENGVFHNALYDTVMLKNIFLASINKKEKI